VQQVDRGREVRREGAEARLEAIQPIRGVGPLQCRDLPQQRDRAVHVVRDVQQVKSMFDPRDRSIADRLEDVGRDPAALIEGVAIDRGERLEVAARHRLVGGAARLGGVGEAIVVALVADERSHERFLREDAFPRVVGEGVELLFRLHEARSFPSG
jgi:hypothetical protein